MVVYPMGNKYKLKRSDIKKRPKKRGKYKEKPKDPNKPSTQDEKDEVFMGYKEINRLAKGIMESNICYECKNQVDECKCDTDSRELTEAFIPPPNWGRLMSNDRNTQMLFEEKLKQQRSSFSQPKMVSNPLGKILDNMDKAPESDTVKVELELSSRLQRVQDRDPSFIRHLIYLVKPILDHPDTVEDNDLGLYDVTEGGKKHGAETSFDKMNPAQIQTMCRKRFGLMSLEVLLNLIDRMNQATSGRLHTGNKQGN